MLKFNEVTPKDKDRLRPMLLAEKDRGCEYTFGNIIIWNSIYATKVAYMNGSAIIRHDKHGIGYLFPVGEYDLQTAVRSMLEDAERENDRFRIFAADRHDFKRLDEAFPGMFVFKEERDYSEYVYLSEHLRELKGKRYHQKRNHISRFLQHNPDYGFSVITPDNIARVREMNDEWCSRYGCEFNESLDEEQCATKMAFDNFTELDFDGGFIESEGKVLAYSMGEQINADVYCVHIEKAFHEIQGSYAIINREFARRFCAGHTYINREDDVGEEGLRKAKLSYNPDHLTDKITISLKNDEQ